MTATGLAHALALLVVAMTLGSASAGEVMPVVDGQPLNPLQSLQPSDFSSFVKRPLFRSTRRPVEHVIPTEAKPDQETVASPEFNLLGVTSTRTGAVARISTPEKASRSVQIGEQIEGWRVQDLDSSSVTLTRDGKTIELKIFRKDDSAEAAEDPGAGPDDEIVFGPADTVDQKPIVRLIENK